MTKGTRIRLQKRDASDAPLFPPGLEDFIPGAINDGVSLPVGYWVTGTLIEDVELGKPIQLLRNNRNGEEILGMFTTSYVESVDLEENTIVTDNSIYDVEVLDAVNLN